MDYIIIRSKVYPITNCTNNLNAKTPPQNGSKAVEHIYALVASFRVTVH